jgi:hemerythrin
MGLITWNTYYSVNIKEIDEQHKKLIDLINRMYDAMKARKGKEVMGDVLTELVGYTAYHFSTEERLFLQSEYPEQDDHKISHDELTRKARALKNAFDQGSDPVTMDVMLFLSNWLNIHILEVDKKYSPYLNSKGIT